MRKIIYVLIAATAFLSACTYSSVTNADASYSQAESEIINGVKIINDTPEEFEKNMNDDFLLLAVRTPEEYNDGHIDGSTLIPVTELESRLNEIEDYKGKTVLVYCRSGNRSVTASEILIDNGFSEVHNLLTGFNGWVTYKND